MSPISETLERAGRSIAELHAELVRPGAAEQPPSAPRPRFARFAEQWVHAVVHSPGPLPVVTPGQTWAHWHPLFPPVEVLAVDRASVWTDRGRTTVFRLLRDRRPVTAPPSHHA